MPTVQFSGNGAGVGAITALVVKTDGSVAWIARDRERSSPSSGIAPELLFYDVYAADRSGTRLLAAGTDVSPSSLALGGSTVYWTQSGTAHTTTLN